MTDYRDPNYRDPARKDYRDPDASMDGQPWSNATWGWIAGISVVVLVLIFAFGGGRDQTASDTSNPPATTGQRNVPAPPPSGPRSDAPTMSRPAPMPDSAPAPAPSTPPAQPQER
ncbi:MAG: hypothetical protein QOG83_2655 [Alphaproteobacteria bacterium]|jgi:hypothetical protein|nr:hypothetical protein [Alphaproteobacteria bacterium]MEA2938035.1 hypothetical protein [Alphaproteobacteria bacterium]MEA2989944.1 hypothetical protein [Alphaproteobacteria bacterium]